jgi:hypothetical protein
MHQNSKSNPIDTQSCLNGSVPYGYTKMVHWRKSIKKNYSPVSSKRLVNLKAAIQLPSLIDSQRPKAGIGFVWMLTSEARMHIACDLWAARCLAHLACLIFALINPAYLYSRRVEIDYNISHIAQTIRFQLMR